MMVLFSVTFVSDSQYCVDESPFCIYNWDLADYDAIENDLLDVDWYSLVTMHPSAPHLWMSLCLYCMPLLNGICAKAQQRQT